MGREVRKVPANWQHPKDHYGEYKPLHNISYELVAGEWLNNCILWANNEHPDQDDNYKYYWEWDSASPHPEYYMPDFPEEEKTHYMMYENTSEGTPISPAFSTPEELAQWLVDNRASAFGHMTASYEKWLSVCNGDYVPSLVLEKGAVKSGVELAGIKD